jgi:hypothetical protein
MAGLGYYWQRLDSRWCKTGCNIEYVIYKEKGYFTVLVSNTVTNSIYTLKSSVLSDRMQRDVYWHALGVYHAK